MLFDPTRSCAVLVGVSDYKVLEPLPAVRNNISELARLLRSQDVWGLPANRCIIVENPERADILLDHISEMAQKATDTLLFYYAGHGILHPRTGELFITVPGSTPEKLYNAVAYRFVRDLLVDTRATRKIAFLDCCYSGRALGQMADLISVIVNSDDNASGTYMMAAAAETKTALAPAGERFTAFTGELVSALHSGIPGGGQRLTLNVIYRHMLKMLRDKQRPIPQARDRNNIGDVPLFQNSAFRPHAHGVANQPPDPPMPGSTEPERRLIPVGQYVFALDFSPDDQLLVTGSRNSLGLWNTHNEERLWKQDAGRWRDVVGSVAFSPDGQKIAALISDRTVGIWETVSGRRQSVHADEILSSALVTAFSPEGDVFAAGFHDKIAWLWNISRDGASRMRFTHPAKVNSLALNLNAGALATGCDDGRARVWDVTSERETGVFKHKFYIESVGLSPDGRWLITGGVQAVMHGIQGFKRAWITRTIELSTKKDGPRFDHGVVNAKSVAVSRDGLRLATGGIVNPGSLRLAPAGIVSLGDLQLATDGIDGLALVWDMATEKVLLSEKYPTLLNVVKFSNDGNRLATGGLENSVRIITIRAG
jgi:WD40 repeat protein